MPPTFTTGEPEMIDEAAVWQLAPPVVVADAGYGEITAFRQGLTERRIGYMLVLKASTSTHPATAEPGPAHCSGRGPRGTDPYREKPSSPRDLALAAGRTQLHQATWRHGTKTGPGNRTAAMTSRFLALRVRPANRDIPLNEDRSLPEAG
ncbi:transposase [Pseudarthrobacter sp. Y6]|uniref:transposase n=1 Tax=Pseudarthrobacter sp. Y6 TaxID=3418422 RepID=UPI003CEA318D